MIYNRSASYGEQADHDRAARLCSTTIMHDQLAVVARPHHRDSQQRLHSAGRLPGLCQSVRQAVPPSSRVQAAALWTRRQTAQVDCRLPEWTQATSCSRKCSVELARRSQRCTTRLSARTVALHHLYQRPAAVGDQLHLSAVRRRHQANRSNPQQHRHGTRSSGHRLTC